MIDIIITLNDSQELRRDEKEESVDSGTEQQSMKLQLLSYINSLCSQSYNNSVLVLLLIVLKE